MKQILKGTLFGTPQFSLEGHSLSKTVTGRGLALLVYLLMTRKPHQRSVLADLLWDKLSETQAKTNLSYQLRNLRKVVRDYLVVTRQTIAPNLQHSYWLDVEVFSAYTRTNLTTVAPEVLQELLNLYQGDFLDGFYIQNASVFEAWMLEQRYSLRQQAIQCLYLLTKHHMIQGTYEAGLVTNQRLLELEPWREEAHRQRMLLFAYTGQRDAALVQYTICQRALGEELDVLPMAETSYLYEQIKSGEWFERQGNIAATPINISSIPIYSSHRRGPFSQLDFEMIPKCSRLYGRQAELATLQRWVVEERSPLVAILGTEGQGKSTLAAHFVQTLEMSDPPFKRVLWRSLQHTHSVDGIVSDWLHQLSGQNVSALPTDLGHRLSLLFEYLQRQATLLVVDNITDDYTELLYTFYQHKHPSCLLLTGRKRPRTLTYLDEQNGEFRCMELAGLPLADGLQMLTASDLSGPEIELEKLWQSYAGNPLMLRQAIDVIYKLFDGDLDEFLQENTFFFEGMGAILEQQWVDLSSLEREIITCLALERKPLTRQGLWNRLPQPSEKRLYLEALSSLRRRFLLEQHGHRFKLQDLIQAYVAEQLQRQSILSQAGEKAAPFHLQVQNV